jgi:hypothetical protein
MCLVHGGVATTGRDAIDDGAISLPWGGLVGWRLFNRLAGRM